MANTCDVAIVGGGVMGSAIAYFLAADPDFDGSIVVIERDPAYRTCATTRSWGGIRQQFSTPENVEMSMFGAAFARRARQVLAVGGEGPDVGFREQGYLFLVDADNLATLEANCRLQQQLGAAVDVLAPDQIAARFPWLNPDGLAGAGFGHANEGWIDPHALLMGFRRKARSLGAEYRADTVVGIDRHGGRVTGVALGQGGRLGCGLLVNAAGPQAGAVADLAGVALPVGPRKRITFVFDCRIDLGSIPLIIDPSGVAFRPEGGQYLAIVAPPADRDPECDDLEIDYTPFEQVIWPVLAHRVPAFAAIKQVGAWAGHYDYNSFDQNAILGPHPDVDGLMFCNGFSGHGLQQSPAAGRAIAELVVHGVYRSIDLSRFGFERLAANRPLREANVV